MARCDGGIAGQRDRGIEGQRNKYTFAYVRPELTSRAAQIQGRNIRHYAAYLAERVKAYRDTKIDWVRARETRLEKLSVDKGLLRETESVQRQLTALLKCDVGLAYFGLV